MPQYQVLYGTILWNGAEAVAGDVIDVDETDPAQAQQLALWGGKAGTMAGVSQIPGNPDLLKANVIPLFAALNLPAAAPPPLAARGRNYFEPRQDQAVLPMQPRTAAPPPRPAAPPTPPR